MNFRSQAKIKLCIHLLEKRPDGYHELVTLMEAVDLADDLIINQQKTGITVTCTNPVVPTDDRNLVVKAVNLVKRKYKLKDQNNNKGTSVLTMKEEKETPVNKKNVKAITIGEPPLFIFLDI